MEAPSEYSDEQINGVLRVITSLKHSNLLICHRAHPTIVEDLFKIFSPVGLKPKPSGLWFGKGTSWLDWEIENKWLVYSADFEFTPAPANFFYKLSLKPNARVITVTDIDAFEAVYIVNGYYDMTKLNQDYDAIVFGTCVNSKRAAAWYDELCAGAGCVWNYQAIEKFQLMYHYDFIEEKYIEHTDAL